MFFFIIWSLYGYGSIPIFIAFLGGYSHPAINPAMTWGEPGTVQRVQRVQDAEAEIDAEIARLDALKEMRLEGFDAGGFTLW